MSVILIFDVFHEKMYDICFMQSLIVLYKPMAVKWHQIS